MNRKQGFTLIELMIVMIIMGILAAIGTTAFVSSMKKGRDSTRKANLRSITNALEMYYNDKGKYPVGESGGIKGCGTDAARTLCPAANGAFQDETPSTPTMYMPKLPTDPLSSQKYYYVSATGVQFQIYARLENSQDPAIMTTSYNCASGAGTAVCNWGLSSANTNP